MQSSAKLPRIEWTVFRIFKHQLIWLIQSSATLMTLQNRQQLAIDDLLVLAKIHKLDINFRQMSDNNVSFLVSALAQRAPASEMPFSSRNAELGITPASEAHE